MKGKKTGGRAKGSPNKVTADIKALAQAYTPAAMEELARLALNAENEGARISTIRELLDRGYGKPTQPMDAKVDASLTITLMRYADENSASQ